MATTVFLQRFVLGKEDPIPFEPLLEFLSQYGTIGRGLGGLEVTFPPDQIADVANIVGDSSVGILCIGLERPVFGNCFREFAFEAMRKFDLFFFDDALESVYFTAGSIDDLPEAIRIESENGITKISTHLEIWPEP